MRSNTVPVDGRGGWVWRGQWGYPARLAACADAPLALSYLGPIERLGAAVAICGAVDARPAALALATDAARLAVLAGYAVVSGGGRGVDIAALHAARTHGGLRVTVLPEGIRHVPAGVVDDGAVVVSQFPPDQPWTVGGAMAGNATMVGLCEALVAIEPASAGAAVDAGMRALALRRPVLAVGDTSGSRLLVDYGATAARDAVELGWWLSRLPTQQKAGLVTVDAP